jgi:hypothetical protein
MVTQDIIRRCWYKSTCITKPLEDEDIVEDNGQAELQQQIAQLPPPSAYEERIPLAEFINLVDETIQDEDSDIFKTVVEYYSIIDEDDEESKVEEEIITIVPISKALEALDVIKLWNLQQADTNGNDTQALDRVERRIVQAKKETVKQASITSFFSRK